MSEQDNGARALAERERAIRKVLRQKDPDSCLWMDGVDEHAAAILANGAAFLPDAAELDRLRRIEAAARRLDAEPWTTAAGRPSRRALMGELRAALRAALAEGSAGQPVAAGATMTADHPWAIAHEGIAGIAAVPPAGSAPDAE